MFSYWDETYKIWRCFWSGLLASWNEDPPRSRSVETWFNLPTSSSCFLLNLIFYYKLFFSFNPQKTVIRETASTSTAVKDELTAANQLFPSSPAPPPSSHHPRVSHYVGSTFSPFFLSFPSWWHQHHHLPLVSCEEKPSSVATGIHLYLQLR